MAQRSVIGLAAGPCASAVDAVLLECEGFGLEVEARLAAHTAVPMPRELRELLLRCSAPGTCDAKQLALADRALGETLAQAALQLADRAGVPVQQILCIGAFGFIPVFDADSRTATYLELGAADLVAERTGLTTLNRFRARDLACGGRGAPMSAIVDWLRYRAPAEDRLVIHLGGYTHVTWLPAGGEPRTIAGWTAGPGNVLLDALSQQISSGKERFDAGGRFAVQGRQITELRQNWLLHPFLQRRPPKALARPAFAEDFARQVVALALQRNWNPHDLLCTASHLVVDAVVDGVRKHVLKTRQVERVILTGSGVRNGFLWRLLEEAFCGIPVESSESYGVPPEMRAALTAGVLACLTLDRVPANLPNVTGARGTRLLGELTPGSAANWARCLDWMTGHVSEPAWDQVD